MDDAPSWAGQGWKDPCLNSSPEKLHPGQYVQNSQGTCPMVGADSPEDGKSLPPFLEEAVQVQVNVPNHVRSHWLKNEGWLICSKLTGDLPHGRGCLS